MSLNIKPKILNNCTLRQACEWIAFGLPPISYDDAVVIGRGNERDDANEYGEDFTKARSLLKVALKEGLIEAKGKAGSYKNHKWVKRYNNGDYISISKRFLGKRAFGS